jgi:PP-loop superfamily ATP-utilizing enzyme
LGFEQVRVRHLGGRATIEVAGPEVPRLIADPRLPRLLRELRSMGWVDVAVDPAGYRNGAMNATLHRLRRRHSD